MASVKLLLHLITGGVDVVAVGNDNIVAGIDSLVVCRLVLSHQGDGDGRGNATKGSGLLGHVDMVPNSCMGKARLSNKL